MRLNQVQLHHLRIFEVVYRHRSMTLAAKELYLTQSGISQHIKALEDQLGITLFDRVKLRLVPRTEAHELYRVCRESFGILETGMERILGEPKTLSGRVRIGLPMEFGKQVIIPLLARFILDHPQVEVQIELGLASIMNDRLLTGDLDLALVDEFVDGPQLEMTPAYTETLELVGSKSLLPPTWDTMEPKSLFELIPYVEYQAGEPLLRMWFQHHLQTRDLRIKPRAQVMDVDAIYRLIIAGVGFGILPSYRVRKLQEQGPAIQIFRGCGRPLTNAIRIATLRGRSQTVAARRVHGFLAEELLLLSSPQKDRVLDLSHGLAPAIQKPKVKRVSEAAIDT